jgi:glycosyltransferase involved in cell wall biosynthesis
MNSVEWSSSNRNLVLRLNGGAIASLPDMVDVILPVLNERESVAWVLKRMPPDFSPIVVDNGSTDDSAAIAVRMGAQVIGEPQRGFGAACWAGLQYASSAVVCFMDCDASLDPRSLPLVAGPVRSDNADLVLGRRIPVRGAWSAHARLANRALAWELRRRTGADLKDLGPMRAARRTDLLSLDIQDRRSGWPLEMILRALAGGWRVTEVPVDYLARKGESKVSGTFRGTAIAIKDMARVLR